MTRRFEAEMWLVVFFFVVGFVTWTFALFAVAWVLWLIFVAAEIQRCIRR